MTERTTRIDLAKELREREHPDCLFCNAAESLGLRLRWLEGADGEMGIAFSCDGRFQSYPGMIHGGVISFLFDGLMTNRLFAEGVAGVTGELKIRFHEPVPVDRELHMSARVVKQHPPLYLLEADLVCGDRLLAWATAKFMERNSREG